MRSEGDLSNTQINRWGEVLFAIGLVIVIAVPLYHDLCRFFLANVDPDLDFSYQALALNAGDSLRFHPHTGHAYVALLAIWLKLIAALGLIETATITPLIEATSDRFVQLYTEIIAAGRALTIFLAAGLLLAVFWVGRLLSNPVGAGLASFVVASNFGLHTQFALLRTEMPAMLCILLCTGCIISAARHDSWRAVMYVGAAAAFAMLAALVKIQAILVLLAVPILAIVLAEPKTTQKPERRHLVLFLIPVALISALPVWRWIEAAVQSSFPWDKVFILIFLSVTLAWYAHLSRQWHWMLPAAAALMAGFSASFYLMYVSDNWWTPFAIVNFYEFMRSDVDATLPSDTTGIVVTILKAVVESLRLTFFSDQITNRAYLFQAVLLMAALLGLRYIRQRRGLVIFYLLGVALVLPALFSPRLYRFYYYIFVEPWGALALAAGVGTLSSRLALTMIVLVSIAVGATQVRFQGLAPSTANSIKTSQVCCYVNYATLITHQLEPLCQATDGECHISWAQIMERQNTLRR